MDIVLDGLRDISGCKTEFLAAVAIIVTGGALLAIVIDRAEAEVADQDAGAILGTIVVLHLLSNRVPRLDVGNDFISVPLRWRCLGNAGSAIGELETAEFACVHTNAVVEVNVVAVHIGGLAVVPAKSCQ
jgi:hypothetical protein